MSVNLVIEKIIDSTSADDIAKGNLIFDKICELQSNGEEEVGLDFHDIELVNTAFLNNAIGQLFDRERFDLNRTRVKVTNMNRSMLPLLKESISNANEKYSAVIDAVSKI